MMTGYYVAYYDGKGKPVLGLTWANRANYYGAASCLMGRTY